MTPSTPLAAHDEAYKIHLPNLFFCQPYTHFQTTLVRQFIGGFAPRALLEKGTQDEQTLRPWHLLRA